MSRFLLALIHAYAAASFAQAASVSGGPMPGHATSRTASVWLQTDGPGQVQIEYWLEQDPLVHGLSLPTRLDATKDYSARIELTGLRPDALYRYEVLLDRQVAPIEVELRLRTLPAWKLHGPPPDFTVYLGSGAYFMDPEWDLPARHEDDGIYTVIAAATKANPQPNLMLWLGGSLDFRETDYDSPWAMNERYRATRSQPALGALLRATRHYAIWNAHDYGPGNRSFEFKAASAELFRRYWANPSYGLPEVPDIFSRFSLFDADFLLLDDRSERACDATVEPDNETSWWQELKNWAIGSNQLTRLLGKHYLSNRPSWLGENKTLFGPAQLDWLKQALIASTATFKVVASGSQLFNDANRFDGWQNFKAEREPFVEWLTRQKISGVVFLSGGVGHTELIRRERKDDYPLYELTCSALSAAVDSPEADNPQRIADTLVGQHNYCTLDVAGKPDNRRLILRAFDAKGRKLWEKQLMAAELQAP